MLPVYFDGHTAYQNFVIENLRKYYPNPDVIARSTWDIIDRFWNLDLTYTDELLRDKYSKFGPAPRTPSCMHHFYLHNLSPHIHPVKSKVKKPKSKGAKADSVETITVAELLPKLENTDFSIEEQPYCSLFKLYKKEFLDQSIANGLIDTANLAIAGDGTPVVTSHRERRHRICKCFENS